MRIVTNDAEAAAERVGWVGLGEGFRSGKQWVEGVGWNVRGVQGGGTGMVWVGCVEGGGKVVGKGVRESVVR